MAGKAYQLYGLSDPATGELRYIGITEQPLRVRLRAHMAQARSGRNTHLYHWIGNLGSAPAMEAIEEHRDRQSLIEAERFYIAYLRYLGFRLVNGTDGGDGGSPSPEARRKIAAARRGSTASAETRAKLSAAGRMQVQSEETKAKRAASMIGRPTSDRTRAAVAEANRRRVFTEAMRLRVSTAMGGAAVVDDRGVVYFCAAEASRVTGISKAQISRVLRGRASHVHGISFRHVR